MFICAKKRLMSFSIIVGLLGSFASPSISAEKVNNSDLQAKAVMSSVYDSYVKIIPYVYSGNKSLNDFKNKKEKEELVKNLTDLSRFFKSAKHAEFFQRPGFRPSLDTINEHLEETIISIESNNFVFAQKRLNVIGGLCVSCHSQLPESVSKNAFRENIKKEQRERFDSDLSYGNYLYLVRRFDEAKSFYNKALESIFNNPNRLPSHEVISILRKILSIDTKIKFDYKISKQFIDLWLKDKRLTKNELKTLSRWGETLKTWKDVDTNTIKSMPEFINKYLAPLDLKKEIIFSGEEDVTLLISSGALLNYLVENPESELAPEILYWLSLIEHRMSQTYFFSLGDLYLKDCIKKYPTSPYAKKCYQEYADSIETGFSGSSGTEIPSAERNELKKLKSLLKP